VDRVHAAAPERLHAVFAYSLESKKSSQITDGMSDALFPRFDKNGKYLYFTASTNTGLTTAGLDMSSDERRVSRSVYLAVLSKDEKSPLAPESDEEKGEQGAAGAAGAAGAKDKDAEKEPKKPVVVKIDLDGIGQRILSLPIPPRNYLAMLSGKSGVLFLAEGPAVITEDDFPNLKQTLHKFDLSKRKTDKFLDEVNAVAISFDGSKLVYRKNDQWTTAATEEPPSGDPKPASGR
jgi:tricorn protease